MEHLGNVETKIATWVACNYSKCVYIYLLRLVVQ